MTRYQKLLERLRANPRNVRFDELDNILHRIGFSSRQRGSHVTYTLGVHRLTVPINRPFLKPVYVRLVLELLDSIEDDA